MQITPRERLMRYAHWLQGTLFGLVEERTGGPYRKRRSCSPPCWI